MYVQANNFIIPLLDNAKFIAQMDLSTIVKPRSANLLEKQ